MSTPMKRGALSASEKQTIDCSKDKMTIEALATLLRRSEKQVQKYIDSSKAVAAAPAEGEKVTSAKKHVPKGYAIMDKATSEKIDNARDVLRVNSKVLPHYQNCTTTCIKEE